MYTHTRVLCNTIIHVQRHAIAPTIHNIHRLCSMSFLCRVLFAGFVFAQYTGFYLVRLFCMHPMSQMSFMYATRMTHANDPRHTRTHNTKSTLLSICNNELINSPSMSHYDSISRYSLHIKVIVSASIIMVSLYFRASLDIPI